MADKLPDKDSFFGGLMNAFATGGQATMSAVQEDLDSLRHGKYPQQAFKAIGDALLAYQNPAMGIFLPPVPTYFSPAIERAKELVSRFPPTDRSPENIKKTINMIYEGLGPEQQALSLPTGKYTPAFPPLNKLFGQK